MTGREYLADDAFELVVRAVAHLNDRQLATLMAIATFEVSVRSMDCDESAAQEPKPAHE